MSVLGSSALGWVDVPMLLPVDGVHAERIQQQSVSLSGVTTTRLRAIKRRYQLPLRLLSPWDAARMMDLYEAPGPLWLFDATREQVTPTARRHGRQWIDTDGVRRDSGASLRITVPANKALSWEPQTAPSMSALASCPEGVDVIIAATLRSATGTPVVQLGAHYYTAAGAYISTLQSARVVSTADQRYSTNLLTPAGAAYLQMQVSTTATGVVMTDPSIGPKDRPGWTVVAFDDMTMSRPNALLTAPTLTLQEVGGLPGDPVSPGPGGGGGGLTEDPDHPGLYFIGDGLTEDPDHPGLYLIGG